MKYKAFRFLNSEQFVLIFLTDCQSIDILFLLLKVLDILEDLDDSYLDMSGGGAGREAKSSKRDRKGSAPGEPERERERVMYFLQWDKCLVDLNFRVCKSRKVLKKFPQLYHCHS